MTSTVRFEDNVKYSKEHSKVTIFEVGPGHVLTTLWKKCSSNDFSSIRTCRGQRTTRRLRFMIFEHIVGVFSTQTSSTLISQMLPLSRYLDTRSTHIILDESGSIDLSSKFDKCDD